MQARDLLFGYKLNKKEGYIEQKAGIDLLRGLKESELTLDLENNNSTIQNQSYYSVNKDYKNTNTEIPSIQSREIYSLIDKNSKNKSNINLSYGNSNTQENDNQDNSIFDSGVPIYNNTNSGSNTTNYRHPNQVAPIDENSIDKSTNYRHPNQVAPIDENSIDKLQNSQQQKTTNYPQDLGNVDVIYYPKLPSNYYNDPAFYDNYNSKKKLYNKKLVKYPDFLLFANDVICTSKYGITDGLIFYTPHGSYKLRGNLLISSNRTYLISGNKIWLDDMIYYFDDSGVYLNDKVYSFRNNTMYREGVKYTIEGSVVTTEGIQGNHRCITSELID